MSSLEYIRPEDLGTALDVLASERRTAALAGGTDLVLQLASGDVSADTLIDIKDIAELYGIAEDRDTLTIGATTRLAELAGLHGRGVDALVDGASIVGSVQTRNRATLGGNVCRSSPAGDTLPSLLVLEAVMELVSPGATRRVPAADFFVGPGANALLQGELLASLRLPLAGGGSAYRRLTYRAWMDLAVIGVAAWLELDDQICTQARIALGGAAPIPILVPEAAAVLVGQPLAKSTIEVAASAIAASARPIDDVRASAGYRRATIAPLARRVIGEAARRAQAPQSGRSPVASGPSNGDTEGG